MAVDKSKIVALQGKQRKPKTISIRVNIMLVDGDKQLQVIPLEGTLPMPNAGEKINLDVALEAREVLATLETALGPQNKPKLWTPGG